MQQKDIARIKQTAKKLKKQGGGRTYMQYLDQAARELYGVRHYHEAQVRSKRQVPSSVPVSPVQHYLHTVQEYYLAI